MLSTLKRALREQLHSHVELAWTGLRWRGEALRVTGTERKSDQKISVAYFGGGYPTQIFEMLFSAYTIQHESGCAMWTAMRRLQEPHAGVDLVLGSLPWTYYPRLRDPTLLCIPSLIVQMLPLPPRFEDLLGGFRRRSKVREVRRMRETGLKYRVVHDVAAVDEFYDTMYVPFARQRFGQFALIDSRKNIRNAAALGGLLQVSLNDRVLGAGVLSRIHDAMYFTWLGLPAGVDPEIADVVRGALYYFTMEYSHQQGCSDLHVGYSTSQLEGGIYQYKRKWGAGLRDDWLLDQMVVRPLNFSAGVRACLANQPFIVRQAGALHGKVLLDGPVTTADLERVAERYSAPGMKSLKVFTTQPLAPALREAQYATAAPLELIDLSGSQDPAADYGRL